MEEEITLLTKEQVDKNRDELRYLNSRYLSVFKKCGTGAKPTDFYIMQGGYVNEDKGVYWSKTPYSVDESYVFQVNTPPGYLLNCSPATFNYGVRPVIPLSKIYQSEKNLNISKINEIEEIEYGEYPQSVVYKSLEDELEHLYQQNRLSKTEKKYTLINKDGKHKYQEYKYYGNKYIRAYCVDICNESYAFSNGRKIEKEKPYWVKVEPIKWLINKSVFKKNNIAISKNLLTSMPFSFSCNNNYEESDIKKFLEKDFVKDIVPSKIIITYEEERLMNQKELLYDRFKKSQVVQDKLVEKERKAEEEAKRIKEERNNEIKELKDGLIQDLYNLSQKYDKLVKLDPDRKIKRPQVYIEKDVLCRYDMEEKCYKIKDEFLPYLSYIEFPYDIENIDYRGLDLENHGIRKEEAYKKSFEGCNLNNNNILTYFEKYDGYNFDNASVYSNEPVHFKNAFINTETIKSVNSEYIKEAIDGAILDKKAVEFLNNNREEYGIKSSINVKVRNDGKIEDMVLFPELSNDDDLENLKYMEKIKELEEQGYTYEDLEKMLNIMKEKAKNKENNAKHM